MSLILITKEHGPLLLEVIVKVMKTSHMLNGRRYNIRNRIILGKEGKKERKKESK